MVPTCRFTNLSFECAESEGIGMSGISRLVISAAGFVGRRLLSAGFVGREPKIESKSSLGPAPRENAQTLGPDSPR